MSEPESEPKIKYASILRFVSKKEVKSSIKMLDSQNGFNGNFFPAVYVVPKCDVKKNYNVDSYLRYESYSNKQNFIGFLINKNREKSEEVEDELNFNYGYIPRKNSSRYEKLIRQFKNRGENRSTFYTLFEYENLEQDHMTKVGLLEQNIEYLFCPYSDFDEKSRTGEEDKQVTDRYDTDYIKGRESYCNNDRFPTHSRCTDDNPVYLARLGMLMPIERNVNEINIIQGGSYKYILGIHKIDKPPYSDDTHNINLYIKIFEEILSIYANRIGYSLIFNYSTHSYSYPYMYLLLAEYHFLYYCFSMGMNIDTIQKAISIVNRCGIIRYNIILQNIKENINIFELDEETYNRFLDQVNEYCISDGIMDTEEDDMQKKYMKYKKKYLLLKKQIK
jgi:hypothetical protein